MSSKLTTQNDTSVSWVEITVTEENPMFCLEIHVHTSIKLTVTLRPIHFCSLLTADIQQVMHTHTEHPTATTSRQGYTPHTPPPPTCPGTPFSSLLPSISSNTIHVRIWWRDRHTTHLLHSCCSNVSLIALGWVSLTTFCCLSLITPCPLSLIVFTVSCHTVSPGCLTFLCLQCQSSLCNPWVSLTIYHHKCVTHHLTATLGHSSLCVQTKLTALCHS